MDVWDLGPDLGGFKKVAGRMKFLGGRIRSAGRRLPTPAVSKAEQFIS